MVGELSIIRPATEDEKKDFIELGRKGHRDILTVFLAKLADKRMEYQKKYVPFDTYCARIDFDESVRKTLEDASNTIGKKTETKVDISDFDKYADPSRFELLETENVKEDKLLDGIRTTVVIGMNFVYKGKLRGNRVTVYVPNEDLVKVQAWVDENFRKRTAKTVEKTK